MELKFSSSGYYSSAVLKQNDVANLSDRNKRYGKFVKSKRKIRENCQSMLSRRLPSVEGASSLCGPAPTHPTGGLPPHSLFLMVLYEHLHLCVEIKQLFPH